MKSVPSMSTERMSPNIIASRLPGVPRTRPQQHLIKRACWGLPKTPLLARGSPPGISRPQTHCSAAPEISPDGSLDVDSDALPKHEVFQDEVVVELEDKECRVFSAVDSSDRIGTVIFLSGFAQTPEAYRGLLDRCASAGVVVVAPLTSTLGISRSHLQNNLVDEAEFWMNQVLNRSGSELDAYLPRPGAPVGILGHSVGGGLTYSLAERFPQAKAIAALSPTPGLIDEFEPDEVIAREDFQTPRRTALVLSGGLDPYANDGTIRREIVAPLQAALGPSAVDFEFHRFGVHTMYQDFIEFPLEDIIAGVWGGEERSEAFLTALEEFPGLLAGQLFLSGLRFELGLALAGYVYGALTDTEWVKWTAGGVAVAALVIAAVVELIKEATGQPEKVSERVARFFYEEF